MDSITLENELKKLVPASLQGSLLDQLDGAMVAAVTEMSLSDEKIIVASSDTELSDLEECLRRLVPYGVPENLISRLDDAMARWHEEVPIDEKIVEINPGVKSCSSSWYGIRSVAAVAILGACAAILSSNLFSEPNRVTERIRTLLTGSQRRLFSPQRMRVVRWFQQKIMGLFGPKADNHFVVWKFKLTTSCSLLMSVVKS